MLRSLISEDQTEILKEIRDVSYEEALRGKDKNGIPYLKHIFELHYKIFGETCSSCPGKITGYIQKLKNYNPKKKMEIIKSEFQLQEGVIIPIAGTSDVYSKHNLTDEVAVQLLAQNPNRKSLFSKLPENVEELIEDYISELEVSGTKDKGGDDQDDTLVSIGNDKVTVEEALSLLEIINIKTKANTVVGVGKKIKELTPELLKELTLIASDFVSMKQSLTQTTEGVKSIDELRAEYETALSAFQELEVSGTKDKGGDDQDDTLVSIGNDKVTVEEALSLLEIINIKTKANTVVGVGKKIKELTPELLKELTLIASDFVSMKQSLTQTTEGVKSIDELRAEYETALSAFQELEVAGTEDEKAVAFKALEDAQIALEEAEKLINKGE
jgi:lipoate synthase